MKTNDKRSMVKAVGFEPHLQLYILNSGQYKREGANLSLTEVCDKSIILNNYNRKHRVVQKIENVYLLTTLDTNKTKMAMGL